MDRGQYGSLNSTSTPLKLSNWLKSIPTHGFGEQPLYRPLNRPNNCRTRAVCTPVTQWSLPLKLKLNFFTVALPLMLNIKYGPGGYTNSFPSDLDLEGLSVLQTISQSSQLCHCLLNWIFLLHISILFLGQGDGQKESPRLSQDPQRGSLWFLCREFTSLTAHHFPNNLDIVFLPDCKLTGKPFWSNV